MKSDQQRELAQLQREKALARYKRQQRERDQFCGDGVYRGRCFSNHGFHGGRDQLGPVATADLKHESEDEENQ